MQNEEFSKFMYEGEVKGQQVCETEVDEQILKTEGWESQRGIYSE